MGKSLAEPMVGNTLPGGKKMHLIIQRDRVQHDTGQVFTDTDRPIDRAMGFVRTANDGAGDRSQFCPFELIGPGDVLRAGIMEDLRLDVLLSEY